MSELAMPPEQKTQMAKKAYKMLIGGEWRDSKTGGTIESIDPSNEEVIATVPDGGDADVAEAVEAGKAAFAEWRTFSAAKRQKKMYELAKRMEERVAHFAMLDTIDSGNPLTGMIEDAKKAPDEIRNFANMASELKGTSFEAPDDVVCFTVREAFGVVGRIIPFNHPYRFAAKVAPGLAAGNAVILKPGETTSLSAIDFGEMTMDIFPKGLVSVVTGYGHTVGRAIVKHPEIMRVAFTGSVPTGQAIMRDAADHMKRLSLELGGKNPMIVFPDVDVDKAAQGCIKGMNLARSMGQSCQSNSRVFVHEKIYDRFVGALVERVGKLKVGDPRLETTLIGPVNHKKHYDRIMGFIESGKDQGAKLSIGGTRPAQFDKGYYVEPTVFSDVTMDMRIAREEIFGPVISVFKWSDYDSVVKEANGTEFGLTANIWTNDLTLANKTAKDMQAGLVWINGAGGRVPGVPFGGYKLSGLGKEGDLSDLLSYTQEKTIITHLQ
jgi:betaine-aldehyde dehydrogenase